MSDLDHLGSALRERMHAHVADISPSTELWASVDAIAETERRPRLRDRLSWRRFAVAVPVPIAAAVAAVLAFGGATPTVSLGTRITWLPNGQVRMPFTELVHVAAANAAFRKVHFPERVVPMSASCPYRNFSYQALPLHPPAVNLYVPPKGNVDKGWTVLTAAAQVGPDELLVATGRFRGGVLPACASSHGWGPAMAPYKSWPAPKGLAGTEKVRRLREPSG